MEEYKVEFEINWENEIFMRIINDDADHIVFYEKVTDRVIKVVDNIKKT